MVSTSVYNSRQFVARDMTGLAVDGFKNNLTPDGVSSGLIIDDKQYNMYIKNTIDKVTIPNNKDTDTIVGAGANIANSTIQGGYASATATTK